MVGTTDYNKEEFIDETLKLNDYLEHKIIFGLDYFSFKDENYYIGLEYKNRSFHFYEPIGFYTSPIYPDIYLTATTTPTSNSATQSTHIQIDYSTLCKFQ